MLEGGLGFMARWEFSTIRGPEKTSNSKALAVDSKKLTDGCSVILCLFFLLLFWDLGTVIFQLSGFYGILRTPTNRPQFIHTAE